MQSKVVLLSFSSILLHYSSSVVTAFDALDIPRINTPAPGIWPQTNVTGCGFTGLPYTDILEQCTEPLNASAPDIRGYWRDTTTGEIGEHIEQCGSRWIDESLPIIHDFPQCTGVVGDGLGAQDYDGQIIASQNTLCIPIVVACKFEQDDDGNKCINLYAKDAATNVTSKVVSRCLDKQNGQMIWIHPIFGTVIYEKVDEEDEPNCMRCVGGEYDGVAAFSTEDVLPCSYEERKWVQCKDDDEEDGDTPATKPSSGHTLQPTAMMVMLLGVLIHFANV